MKTISAKLYAGYLLVIATAMCGFIAVLILGQRFQDADRNNQVALTANAQALQSARMTGAAEVALLRYQSTLSGQDRKALFDALANLTQLDASLDNLKQLATRVSDLSQTYQGGVQKLIDAVAAISMPVMAVSELKPESASPEFTAAEARLSHAYALLTLAAGRYAARIEVRSIDISQYSIAQFKKALDLVRTTPEALDAHVAHMLGLIARDLKAAEDIFAAQAKTYSDQQAAIQAFMKAVEGVKEKSLEAAQRAEAGFTQATSIMKNAGQMLIQSVWIAAPATLLLGIAIAFAMARSISRPVGRLTTSVKEIAHGNLGIELPETARGDELGALAASVLVLRDQSREKVRLEAEAAAQRAAAEQERARAEAERTAIAREQAQVVEDLGRALAKLATRDLTVHLSDFPSDYRKLESDFNAAVTSLQETVAVVASNSHSILTGVAEISSGGIDLAKRTECQAASLEETAAAIDEITVTGRKSAEGARLARDTVATAKADAETTGAIVRKTVEAMGAIEQGAQKINQIITVIDEIAFQTNLLALNAGVEAARAGDAGRGFAVVASEVRGLAQRSAEAAREIKQLISASSSQVAKGVELVANAGEAVDRILTQVGDINRLVNDIASGAQGQAVGLAEVNTAINQMDQATQQNASMVQEQSAASNTLKLEAEQLVELVGRFRLEGAGHDRRLAKAA